MTAAAFLRLTGLTVLIALGVVAGLNVIIDPYDLWGSPKVAGFNVVKPALHSHLADAKKRQYLRVRPHTVVAGNSRVDVGIDPESPVWSRADRPVYNFGLPGVRVDGVVQALRDVFPAHQPARIYLGVDFIDFSVSQADWMAFRPLPYAPGVDGVDRQFRRITTAVLSLDALVDSVSTIAEQRARHPQTTRADGFSPLDHYNDMVASEGHASIFAQRSLENARSALGRPKAVAWPVAGNSQPWYQLEAFIVAARRRGIDVVLFTYPYHVELLETFRQSGQWPALLDWQRRLTVLAARHQLPLWSFIGYNAWTGETVPPPGDHHSRMRWYWEAGHFKAALGDQMIQRMQGEATDAVLPGRRLTPANIDAALVALEQERAVWRAGDLTVSQRVSGYVARITRGG